MAFFSFSLCLCWPLFFPLFHVLSTCVKDDPCPDYLSEESCDIEDDYELEETRIIIHDKDHLGTFEELEFEWDDRYVDGGYFVKRS